MFQFLKACGGFVAFTGEMMKYFDLRQRKQQGWRKWHKEEFVLFIKYYWSVGSSVSI
jgi:hypothetical protein